MDFIDKGVEAIKRDNEGVFLIFTPKLLGVFKAPLRNYWDDKKEEGIIGWFCLIYFSTIVN